MKQLISSTVDSQMDLTEQALRTQYNHMRTAHAAIICMGRDAQPDSALMVFYDNALPQAYSTVRQPLKYSISSGFAFESMSAPIDDAFSTFHRDEAGELLHGAAISAATVFAVTNHRRNGRLPRAQGLQARTYFSAG